jgi:hypothetical protein
MRCYSSSVVRIDNRAEASLPSMSLFKQLTEKGAAAAAPPAAPRPTTKRILKVRNVSFHHLPPKILPSPNMVNCISASGVVQQTANVSKLVGYYLLLLRHR